MLTLAQFATANGFENVAQMTAALGGDFVQTAYADARNAALSDAPAIPAAPVVTWRDEVLAMFDGEQKDGTRFLATDPLPLIVPGSDADNGIVVGIDGANANAVRICRYETRAATKKTPTPGRTRIRQQPVWTLDTALAVADAAATLLDATVLDASDVLANVTETTDAPTLAEQLAAANVRSELLKIAAAHGVDKVPHASKMRLDTLRKRILAAAANA